MKDRFMKLRRPVYLMRTPLFFFALLFLIFPDEGARADFIEGLRAYDGGELEAAAAYWQEEAKAGNLEAITALADLYARGTGVEQNWREAARLYERAASHGDRVAQLNLGEFYRDGLGVKKSHKLAAFWLSIAARQGSKYAARELEPLLLNLNTSDRQEVLDRVANWKPLLPN